MPFATSLAELDPELREEALTALPPSEKARYLYTWPVWARPAQLPPEGDWRVWLLLSGRGFGKTRAGGEWVREQVEVHGRKRGALVAPTAADVRDIVVEGESGLLAISPPWFRPVYEPSKRRLTWPNGAVCTLYSADEPNRLRGPQHDFAWCDELACVVGETLVHTEVGLRRVDEVRPGERVWTRAGLRRVTDAWCSSLDAEVWELVTSDGRTLRGTHNHPVWTPDGFVALSSLSAGVTLRAWDMEMETCCRASSGAGGDGGSTEATTATGAERCSTEPSTAPTTDLSPTGSTSITSTATSSTTTPPTSKLSVEAPISGVILGVNQSEYEPPDDDSGLFASLMPSPAPTADRSSLQQALERASARRAVGGLTSEPDTRSRLGSTPVGPTGPAPSAAPRSALATREPPAVRVAAVTRTGQRAPVYNLSVEGDEEYFANGLLVHNSWRYPEAWDMLLFGLRLGREPQAVVTTTPRPTKLIRELIAKSSTVVTRGSTYENRANLAPGFFADIIAAYEGTTLGRQEIWGEVIEDVAGALWNRRQLDGLRVGPSDITKEELKLIVVAIDPAVTSGEESDETGIVVAGVDEDGVGYVLDDLSGRYPPEEWATKATNAYHRWEADRIVGEVNNGGDLVQSVIRQADPEVKFRKVHASRGKYVRAEPLSLLYERGRVHHVGMFGALEDQMCNFTPDMDRKIMGSPDRVDALVWAFYELIIKKHAGKKVATSREA